MSLLNLLPIIIILCGSFMLIKLRLFFILHPVKTLREIKGALRNPDGRRSLLLALAGTLGVGNIVGVAVGISIGGAGSVFWLLLSSTFASALKYSESSAARLFSAESGDGMMCVLKHSFKRNGVLLGNIYAFLCVLLSLSMGAMLQTASAAISVGRAFGIDKILVGAAFSVCVVVSAIFFSCGIKRITERVIPIAVVAYVLLALSVIFQNVERVPQVVSDIFTSAFSIKGGMGGIFGFFTSSAVREGFCRGILSNEAGAGTSSLAHSEIGTSAHRAGLLGMCEVVFDTVILCTLTALAILTATDGENFGNGGVELVFETLGESFGSISASVLAGCIFLFAYSTVICWYYYGQKCVRYLFGGGSGIYTTLFLVFSILGVFFDEKLAVFTSDYILLGLCALTVFAIIKSSDRIAALSEGGD